MHRALFIAEVARNIAFHQPAKKDLAALAQTCRALSEPALDALWAELESVIPLLECLPEDLISRAGFTPPNPKKRYKLVRPLVPADWVVFRKYTSKIMVLESVIPRISKTSPSIDTEIFRALCWPPTLDPLFPKLRHLICPRMHSEILPFLRLILGPTITSLVISPPLMGTNVSDLCLAASLSAICPRVKHLEWRDDGPLLEEEVALLSKAVTSWKDLETVSAPLDGHALQHLSSLTSLRSLDVSLTGASSYPSLCEPAFPNAHHLTFRSSSLSDVAPLVRAGRFSPAVFSVSADGGNPESWGDLFTALSCQLNKMSLMSLAVAEGDLVSGLVLERSTFQDLSRFHELRTVNVDTYREIDLDDAALLEMADALPNLHSLSVNAHYGWRRRSGVTLHGVRAMLQRLPELTMLAIAIDAQAVELNSTEDEQYGRYQITRPFKLNVLDSRVGTNHAEVAAVLSDIFPMMDEKSGVDYFRFSTDVLRSMEDDFVVYNGRWADVLQTVLVMNRVMKRKGAISGSV